MKVLITGGTGFIGSSLALGYVTQGDTVRVLAQENNAAESAAAKRLEQAGVTVALGSVTDKDSVSDAVKGMDVVVHLAAAQHEANIPDSWFWEVNVAGTRNLLEASEKAGVNRFVYGSTIGVYGSMLQGTLDEDSPAKPSNIYGVTKLEAESLVRSFAGRLPTVAVRISETYGPGDYRLLKLFRAIKKGRFFVIGPGNNRHHPVYITDLVRGLMLAASKEEALGQVFVLPGKEVVTTNEMVEVIARQLAAKVPRLHAPMPPFLLLAKAMGIAAVPLRIQPPLHPRRMDFFRTSFVLSGEKAAHALAFAPRYGFADGVAKTARWYEEMGYL